MSFKKYKFLFLSSKNILLTCVKIVCYLHFANWIYKIYVLNNILEKTNAKIILTTSHKSNYTNEQWTILFKNRNIDAVIETLPKNVDNLSRKDEIINYLDSNLDDYLIIDDDSQLNTLPSHIKEKLILTSPLIGLVEEHIEKILIIILND